MAPPLPLSQLQEVNVRLSKLRVGEEDEGICKTEPFPLVRLMWSNVVEERVIDGEVLE